MRTANATASAAMTTIAQPTVYPAIHANACASSMGNSASCGYTHDWSMPTMPCPCSALVDHGS